MTLERRFFVAAAGVVLGMLAWAGGSVALVWATLQAGEREAVGAVLSSRVALVVMLALLVFGLAVFALRRAFTQFVVAPARLLEQRIGEAFVTLHPNAAEKLGIAAGQRATISLDGTSEEVVVRLDQSISTGVALVPRSMGLPITEPTRVRIKALQKATVK